MTQTFTGTRGVPGASFVRTASFDETFLKASEMLHVYGAMTATGIPGVGKSATCREVMRELTATFAVPGVWLQLGRNPSPKEVVCQLLRALGMRPQRSEPTWVLSIELGDLLANEPRSVWVDEAQYLRTDAFTTLRTIHDRPDAQWLFCLVGSHELPKRLRADQPELASRSGRTVKFHKMENDAVLLSTLNQWHPLLTGCDDARLLRMNRIGPKGIFRRWEQLLETIVRLTVTVGSFTEQVEALALHQNSYVLPAELARWLPQR